MLAFHTSKWYGPKISKFNFFSRDNVWKRYSSYFLPSLLLIHLRGGEKSQAKTKRKNLTHCHCKFSGQVLLNLTKRWVWGILKGAQRAHSGPQISTDIFTKVKWLLVYTCSIQPWPITKWSQSHPVGRKGTFLTAGSEWKIWGIMRDCTPP